MRIGIVGNGVVGRHLNLSLSRANVQTVVFDRYDDEFSRIALKEEINGCDLVFVAVPTVAGKDGECDLTEVREAVSWIQPPICLKSTVIPGTTDRLSQEFQKDIIFGPEYIGESVFHRSVTTSMPDLIAFGGPRKLCERFLALAWNVYGPEPMYFQSDAVTVELAKYMENCFLATKVAFVSEFYMLAQKFGANFAQMRELWLADPRVGRSHSTVVGELGFGGKCLPKDLSAIIHESARIGFHATFLEALDDYNRSLRSGIPK